MPPVDELGLPKPSVYILAGFGVTVNVNTTKEMPQYLVKTVQGERERSVEDKAPVAGDDVAMPDLAKPSLTRKDLAEQDEVKSTVTESVEQTVMGPAMGAITEAIPAATQSCVAVLAEKDSSALGIVVMKAVLSRSVTGLDAAVVYQAVMHHTNGSETDFCLYVGKDPKPRRRNVCGGADKGTN